MEPPVEPPIISPESLKPKSPQGVFIILGLILIIGLFFAYKYFQLKKQVPSSQATSIPSPAVSVPASASPSAAVADDLTADWLLYTNSIQNYSLKYPSDWQIDTSAATVDINNKLTLAKDSYIITIYANIQGVNGVTRQVPSTPITLSGLNLFKRDIGDNFYTKTGSLEISATDSNPTFKYQDKIYEIYLTFPLDDKGSVAYLDNLKTFDLILTTFKFNP